MTESKQRGWLDEAWVQVVPLAAAAIAYTATDELGGSGFIAAFMAGLLYGRRIGPTDAHTSSRLMEEIGGVLSAVTFFVFGAILIGNGVTDLDLSTIIYAVLSLTAVRMVPVALSLIGSGADRPTMAFTGWFGPRGLATIVFMLTIIEETNLAGTDRIVQVATITVLLSIVAHGASAPWLTERYVRRMPSSDESSEFDLQDDQAPVTRPRRSLWVQHPQKQR